MELTKVIIIGNDGETVYFSEETIKEDIFIVYERDQYVFDTGEVEFEGEINVCYYNDGAFHINTFYAKERNPLEALIQAKEIMNILQTHELGDFLEFIGKISECSYTVKEREEKNDYFFYLSDLREKCIEAIN